MLLLLLFVLLSSTYALAQPVTCDVTFHVTGDKGLTIDGTAGQASGTLTQAAGKTSGTLTAHLDQVDTGIGLRNHHAKEMYLEVGKYPAAELALDPTAVPSSGSFKWTGKLTLHGVTKAVAGTAGVDGKTFTASFGLVLTDYGIDVPCYLGICVAKDVQVTVTGPLK